MICWDVGHEIKGRGMGYVREDILTGPMSFLLDWKKGQLSSSSVQSKVSDYNMN